MIDSIFKALQINTGLLFIGAFKSAAGNRRTIKGYFQRRLRVYLLIFVHHHTDTNIYIDIFGIRIA